MEFEGQKEDKNGRRLNNFKNMKLNKSLSWKITLPIGIILLIVGHGGAIGFLGYIIGALGIVGLITDLVKRKKGTKTEAPK